jgi:hypothetical protein
VIDVLTEQGFEIVAFSSPELTALDLADRPQRGGGVSSVATVLAEMAADPGLSAGGLAELAARFPAGSARRLGYLLHHAA